MSMTSLIDLNLHDSRLLGFFLYGEDSSEVIMRLAYIEDYETLRTSDRRLVFSGCVKVVVDAYVLATSDSLRTGYEVENSPMLAEVKLELERSGFPDFGSLKHFYVE